MKSIDKSPSLASSESSESSCSCQFPSIESAMLLSLPSSAMSSRTKMASNLCNVVKSRPICIAYGIWLVLLNFFLLASLLFGLAPAMIEHCALILALAILSITISPFSMAVLKSPNSPLYRLNSSIAQTPSGWVSGIAPGTTAHLLRPV